MSTQIINRPVEVQDDHARPSHGVHVTCQLGKPHVVSLCGQTFPWEDEVAKGARDVCVVCADLKVCPVCKKQVLA